MDASVIIPTLNEASLIATAISRAWAIGPREVIVVDGGSRDGTAGLARAKRCLFLESRPGRAAQQNLGASRAQGEVLLFLHADSWLDPVAAGQIAAILEAEAVLCGAFRQKIESSRWLYRLLECGNAARVKLFSMAYGDQGIFVRRTVFAELGGFPDVPLMEDVLLMKALRQRSRVALLPGPIYVSPRRWQRYGVVRQTARNWLLLAALALGVSPARLAVFYPPQG